MKYYFKENSFLIQEKALLIRFGFIIYTDEERMLIYQIGFKLSAGNFHIESQIGCFKNCYCILSKEEREEAIIKNKSVIRLLLRYPNIWAVFYFLALCNSSYHSDLPF